MGLERFHDFIPASEKEKNNTTSASASSHYHGTSDTIVRLSNESQWLIARRLPVYGAFPCWLKRGETRLVQVNATRNVTFGNRHSVCFAVCTLFLEHYFH